MVFFDLLCLFGLLWCFSAYCDFPACCGVFRLAVFVWFAVMFSGLLYFVFGLLLCFTACCVFFDFLWCFVACCVFLVCCGVFRLAVCFGLVWCVSACCVFGLL